MSLFSDDYVMTTVLLKSCFSFIFYHCEFLQLLVIPLVVILFVVIDSSINLLTLLKAVEL